MDHPLFKLWIDYSLFNQGIYMYFVFCLFILLVCESMEKYYSRPCCPGRVDNNYVLFFCLYLVVLAKRAVIILQHW